MLNQIKCIIIDVDGTLTDGGIYYDNLGNEWKKFNTKDAAGIFAARQANIDVFVMTGRESKAVERRMEDLKVVHLEQNVKDKKTRTLEYMNENNYNSSNMAYIGDDLNDLSAMRLCGYVGCPKDAAKEIKEIANYISGKKGGKGAVRDIIHNILVESNEWDKIIKKIYQ